MKISYAITLLGLFNGGLHSQNTDLIVTYDMTEQILYAHSADSLNIHAELRYMPTLKESHHKERWSNQTGYQSDIIIDYPIGLHEAWNEAVDSIHIDNNKASFYKRGQCVLRSMVPAPQFSSTSELSFYMITKPFQLPLEQELIDSLHTLNYSIVKNDNNILHFTSSTEEHFYCRNQYFEEHLSKDTNGRIVASHYKTYRPFGKVWVDDIEVYLKNLSDSSHCIERIISRKISNLRRYWTDPDSGLMIEEHEANQLLLQVSYNIETGKPIIVSGFHQNVEGELISVNGMSVHSITIAPSVNTIDTIHLSKGLYILKSTQDKFEPIRILIFN